MFGTLKTNDLPWFRTYADAQRFYTSTTPVRGSTIRPLGDRRAKHKQIVEVTRDGVKGYACRLYATDCLTFFEDGRIHVNHGNYITTSTKDFINAVFPRAYVSAVKLDLLLHVLGGSYLVPEEGLYLDKDLKPINAVPCVVHKINRKGANAVRARYSSFIAYALGMTKLVEGEFVEGKYNSYRYDLDHDELAENMMSEDPENQTQVILAIARKFGSLRAGFESGEYLRKIDVTQMKAAIERVLIHAHSDEMLVTETLPLGQWKHNKYHKYTN